MWPPYEKVSDLDVPISVHVSLIPEDFDTLRAPYNLNETMTREFELAATNARLVHCGVTGFRTFYEIIKFSQNNYS